jgi:hypothetical protein
MTVSDSGLSSAWVVERIDYALSNLSYSIAGGTAVVGFTVATILAIGCSFTRKVALSHGTAVDEDVTFASWYGATCGPECTTPAPPLSSQVRTLHGGDSAGREVCGGAHGHATCPFLPKITAPTLCPVPGPLPVSCKPPLDHDPNFDYEDACYKIFEAADMKARESNDCTGCLTA